MRLEPDAERLDPGILPRVRLTVSCGDCDDLPKVADAGLVHESDGTLVQVMHNGVLVEAGGYFGDWMAEIIRCLRGHHEPQEELVVARILERLRRAPGPLTAVELGSFWAYYSLWFLDEFPDGRVVALEPDPANLEVGLRNFRLNGREGTFVHGTMGREPGGTESFANLDGSRTTVRQYDLAGLLAETGVAHVHVLFCDIQGGEQFLFDQAAELLRAGVVRFAVISTHHHSISGDALTHHSLLERLRELGAHVVAEHTVGESVSGDGLIAVSFDPRDSDVEVHLTRARQDDSLFGPLERELAAAQAATRAAEAALLMRRQEADRLAATLETAERRGAAAERELATLRSTRLLRWSTGPRALYARALNRRGRVSTLRQRGPLPGAGGLPHT